MILGIDLATVNCGICFMEDDETCSFATVGMKDLEPETILKFTSSMVKIVSDQVCYIDFHFNECFLPNKKKHIAVKYFLAGAIVTSAKQCNLVKPSEVRQHFGFDGKLKKNLFHEQMFINAYNQNNEHERDAYLLALMGLQQQRMKQ